MRLFKKTLAALATIGAMTAAGSANAYLTNWYLDTDGAGANNAPQLVQDYVDLVGNAYVKNSFTSLTTFSFKESGIFTTASADGGSALGGQNLNPPLISSFFGTGTGTTGGALSFATGTLTIRSGATTVGVFDLTSGSANLFANSTLPNGTISIIFKATSLASGYFFDSSMNDLSSVVSNPDGLLFGFATTNAISSTNVVPNALITLYNANFDPDVASGISGDGRENLLISNNGQYRLQVPEPASLALTGLALFGLGALRRRREVK